MTGRKDSLIGVLNQRRIPDRHPREGGSLSSRTAIPAKAGISPPQQLTEAAPTRHPRLRGDDVGMDRDDVGIGQSFGGSSDGFLGEVQKRQSQWRATRAGS
ncbi:MAG: hypothetical protein KIT69_08100, partial [Propionibacteriaceae bacterium]|nr:hypothetical protein [Propionibacteriaceae bacterium]